MFPKTKLFSTSLLWALRIAKCLRIWKINSVKCDVKDFLTQKKISKIQRVTFYDRAKIQIFSTEWSVSIKDLDFNSVV